MARNSSSGQCRLCGATLAKAAVSRHLAACAKAKTRNAPASAGKKGRGPWLHMALEGAQNPRYWLHLAVPSELPLSTLDAALRGVWMECCGHMSSFIIGGSYFNGSPWGVPDFIEETETMDGAIGEILLEGDRFEYEYDFGSTTRVKGRVLTALPPVFKKRVIHLLARNEPPDVRCASCGKAARQLCTECACSGPATFCDACAKKHKCDEEMLLPVVNSPRVGVCAYCGPSSEP